MKKRLLSALLALCLLLSLAACGQGSAQGTVVSLEGISFRLPAGLEPSSSDLLTAKAAWKNNDVGSLMLYVSQADQTMDEIIEEARSETDFHALDTDDLGPLAWYSTSYDNRTMYIAQFLSGKWAYSITFTGAKTLQEDPAAARRLFEELLLSLKKDSSTQPSAGGSPAPASSQAAAGDDSLLFRGVQMDPALFDLDHRDDSRDQTELFMASFYEKTRGMILWYTRAVASYDQTDLENAVRTVEAPIGRVAWAEPDGSRETEDYRLMVFFVTHDRFYSIDYYPSQAVSDQEAEDWLKEFVQHLTWVGESDAPSPAPSASPAAGPVAANEELTFRDVVLQRVLFEEGLTREDTGSFEGNGAYSTFRDGHGTLRCYARKRDNFDSLEDLLAMGQEMGDDMEYLENGVIGTLLWGSTTNEERILEQYGQAGSIEYRVSFFVADEFLLFQYLPTEGLDEEEAGSWFFELVYSMTLTPEGLEKVGAAQANATPTPKPTATPEPTPTPVPMNASDSYDAQAFTLETFRSLTGCDPENFTASDPQPFTVYCIRTGQSVYNAKLVDVEELDPKDLKTGSSDQGLEGWIQSAREKAYKDQELIYTSDPNRASVILIADITYEESGKTYSARPNLVAYTQYYTKTAYNAHGDGMQKYSEYTTPGTTIEVKAGQTAYYAGSSYHDWTHEPDQTSMEESNDWGPGGQFAYYATQWLLPVED